MGFPPFVAFARMTAADNPQAVSRAEGLTILTQAGAVAEFAEREKGRLKPGMLADLIVLSHDVTVVPTADLPKTRSLLTLVGGKIAYSSGEFASWRAPTSGQTVTAASVRPAAPKMRR
jgi:hypothetical protein